MCCSASMRGTSAARLWLCRTGCFRGGLMGWGTLVENAVGESGQEILTVIDGLRSIAWSGPDGAMRRHAAVAMVVSPAKARSQETARNLGLKRRAWGCSSFHRHGDRHRAYGAAPSASSLPSSGAGSLLHDPRPRSLSSDARRKPQSVAFCETPHQDKYFLRHDSPGNGLSAVVIS
jgi:hypothetical protein